MSKKILQKLKKGKLLLKNLKHSLKNGKKRVKGTTLNMIQAKKISNIPNHKSMNFFLQTKRNGQTLQPIKMPHKADENARLIRLLTERFNNLEIEGNPEHFEANLRVLN